MIAANKLSKHNIKWSLPEGSIIRTVQYQGFISWDDDIDIFIERKEFEYFKTELAQNYELRLPSDNEYLFHFP